MAKFDISQHAAERFVERIAPHMTLAEARDEIRRHARAIGAAIRMGCKCIRLGCGGRIVIDPALGQVITVLPKPAKNRSLAAARRATRERDYE